MTEPSLTPFGEDHPVESLARRVTFFEDRAEVQRTVTLRASEGRVEHWIAGLSAFVDDGSLRARVRSGEATVLAASVARRSRRERALSLESLARLEAERDDARRECLRIQRAIERLSADADRARTLASHWLKALAEVPAGINAEPVAHAWREAYDAVVLRHEETEARLRVERGALRDADRVVAKTDRALREGTRETPTVVALARLQLEVKSEGEIEIELVYRVPCALWRPEHTARLERDGESGTAKVRWTTAAVAWQRTGERWDDVEVRFSTARPARAASPPLLREDALSWRKKTDHERQRVVVDAREQTIAVAGVDRVSKSVSEMPGVDDGGEPLSLSPAGRVGVPSTGRPVRVEVASVTLEAAVDRVLYPERSGAPHLRATVRWSASLPLLAGPVRVARGASLVGRGRVAFVGQGEAFEVGFGADDAVRARRRVDEVRDTVPVIGTQKVKRTVRVFLSNASGEARSLRLIERIPVSEIADVEVALGAHEGWKHKPADGMLERDLDLAPREARELVFEYELRASAKVELPF